MKSILLLASLLVSLSSFARSEYAEVKINWNDRYLSEGFALMCDDTSLSGVELIIPGEYKYGVESDIIFKDCPASTKILKKQRVIENGIQVLKVRIKVSETCDIEVREDKRQGKKFELNISDAC
jgi:hypothetical protein